VATKGRVAWKKWQSEVAPWWSTKLTGGGAARRHGVQFPQLAGPEVLANSIDRRLALASPWWSPTDSLQHCLAACLRLFAVPFIATCAAPPNEATIQPKDEGWGACGSHRRGSAPTHFRTP